MAVRDRIDGHRRLLGLLPGAPECVIKAAHRLQIELHHPDRGGDADAAKAINVAYDELKGRGAAANTYVAANYHGEPWVVLGLSSVADERLVMRAGKQLASELAEHRRLADRVAWAVEHFAAARTVPRRVRPATPSSSRRPAPKREAPAVPATPGMPEGLPRDIDFGRVAWREEVTRILQLTWQWRAPFDVKVEAPAPLRAEVTASKVLPGRFSIAISVDWDSPALSRSKSVRGHTLDATLTLRWTAAESATVRIKALLLYPALVSASPTVLDLGTAGAGESVSASLILIATAPVGATLELPAWLERVDGAGRRLDAPVALQTDVPVRVGLRVAWEPVLERGKASLDAGRAVRPTGRITVSWEGDRSFEIPAAFVATPRVASRR